MIDLQRCCAWNLVGSFTYFAQDHYAAICSRPTGPSRIADAVADAVIECDSAYTAISMMYLQLQLRVRLYWRQTKALLCKLHPEFEGCCMGTRASCTAGALLSECDEASRR